MKTVTSVLAFCYIKIVSP